MSDSTATKTGGRAATTANIDGDCVLAVGTGSRTPPSGWRWQLLTSLARLETGHTPSRKQSGYWDGDIPWIGIRDATGNHGRTIYDTEQHVTQAGIDNSSARLLPEHTVCLSRTASVGYVVVMGRPMATSQDFINWVCDPDALDYRFLKYVLLAEKGAYGRFSHGTTHQTIYFPEVKAFHVCAPEIDGQQSIADALASLDDKIEQNRKTAGVLERLARAVFRAWFVDFEPVHAKAAGATSFPSMPQPVFDRLPTTFTPGSDSDLGPIPEGWEVKPLSKMCTILSGGTPKRSEARYWGGDIPWYSVKDAPAVGQVWAYSTNECITDDGLHNSAAQIVPKGCTIISARGTVGRLALAGRPMAFNQSCYGLMPVDEQSFAWLHMLMRSVVTDLQQRTHGSVFDTITRSTFDGLAIAAPPNEYIRSFEEVATPSFDLLLASHCESMKLAELRDYLLPKLLSGAVRVQPQGGGAS